MLGSLVRLPEGLHLYLPRWADWNNRWLKIHWLVIKPAQDVILRLSNIATFDRGIILVNLHFFEQIEIVSKSSNFNLFFYPVARNATKDIKLTNWDMIIYCIHMSLQLSALLHWWYYSYIKLICKISPTEWQFWEWQASTNVASEFW